MFPLLQKSFIFEFLPKKRQKTLQFLDKLNWEQFCSLCRWSCWRLGKNNIYHFETTILKAQIFQNFRNLCEIFQSEVCCGLNYFWKLQKNTVVVSKNITREEYCFTHDLKRNKVATAYGNQQSPPFPWWGAVVLQGSPQGQGCTFWKLLLGLSSLRPPSACALCQLLTELPNPF